MNLMIMTGTGSGKTESFLLPILGKLAIEAKEKSAQFAEHSAVRAMVLYPMNALVNDQLGRLRLLFGDPRVVEMFQAWSDRMPECAPETRIALGSNRSAISSSTLRTPASAMQRASRS